MFGPHEAEQFFERASKRFSGITLSGRGVRERIADVGVPSCRSAPPSRRFRLAGRPVRAAEALVAEEKKVRLCTMVSWRWRRIVVNPGFGWLVAKKFGGRARSRWYS
jgi:hypothetical protein